MPRISELPGATLPLAGTELIPLVQGGTTKSAPASALGNGGSGGGGGGGTPSSALPLMNGAATPGTSTNYAREGHVHPSDTTRADVALSNLSNQATARTNLGLGTAALKAASGSGGTVASTTGTFSAGHVAVFADSSGTIQDGGAISGGGTITGVTAGFGLAGGGFSGAVTLTVTPATTTTIGGVTFSGANPAADGVADPGSGFAAARANHVHPTDTTRAPLSLTSVALSGATTLTFAAHHLRDLYTTASMTLALTNAATLGDGFKACVYTDATHTVTLSGTAYDLAGNAVASIASSSKAEIEVWGGQVYALVSSTGLVGSYTHGTASSTINFVGYDSSNLDYRFGFDDFVGYALAAGGVFSKRVAVAPVALTDAATIATDASLGNVFTVTLGGNRTLGNPTNLVAGQEVTWIITQDGTGSRTLAYGNLFTWPGGSAPTLSTAAGAVDVVSGIYGGIKIRAAASKAYA